MTWPNRAERRREWAKRAARIEAPPEIDGKVREQIATAIGNRRLEFRAGESVQAVFMRLVPELFEFVRGLGYALSFDLPEMTPAALARGVIAYSLTRPLN